MTGKSFQSDEHATGINWDDAAMDIRYIFIFFSINLLGNLNAMQDVGIIVVWINLFGV